MNLQNILNSVASEDPEFYERTSDRRSTIRTFLKGAALTAVPFALGGLLKKAYGQAVSADIIGVLNFALTLEYLEAEFYNTGIANATSIGIPQGAAFNALSVIQAHENAHVAFLKTAIAQAGGVPVAKPNFDLSGGAGSGNGPFKAALQSDYNLFLAVAQTFEDTGVRAYKGQAGVLIPNNAILTAALQIHSVEARHAAHIRYMRARTTSGLVDGTVKSWITGNKSGINAGNSCVNAAINKSYAGEELTNQAGVNIAGFVSSDSASESFDEPLTKAQILDIVSIFIAP
jgi:hypothetical protein